MSRWWAVALLFLSVGLNLGLAVAVLQQRLSPATPAGGAATATSAPVAAPAAPAVAAPPAAAPPPAPAAAPAPATVAPAPREPAVDVVEAQPIQGSREPYEPLPSRPPGHAPGAREVGRGLEGPPPGNPPLGGPPREDLRGGGPSQERLEEVAARLGVPVEDRPQFIALQRRFIAGTRERKLELEAVRRDLRAELIAASPDRGRLRELVESSARLQAALERAFVEHVLAARELLDGEPERRYLEFLSRLGPRVGAPGPRGGAAGPRMGEPRRQRRWGGGAVPGRGRRALEAPRWMPAPAPPSPTPPGEGPRRETEPPLLQAQAAGPS